MYHKGDMPCSKPHTVKQLMAILAKYNPNASVQVFAACNCGANSQAGLTVQQHAVPIGLPVVIVRQA